MSAASAAALIGMIPPNSSRSAAYRSRQPWIAATRSSDLRRTDRTGRPDEIAGTRSSVSSRPSEDQDHSTHCRQLKHQQEVPASAARHPDTAASRSLAMYTKVFSEMFLRPRQQDDLPFHYRSPSARCARVNPSCLIVAAPRMSGQHPAHSQASKPVPH